MERDHNDISRIPKFIHHIESLKHNKRFTTNPFVERKDTVASHSWRASLLFLSFEGLLPETISRQKVYELLTMHDLTELEKEGTKALGFRNEKENIKEDREDDFSQFSYLAEPLYKKLRDLWSEYKEQKSVESKIAKTIERLESNWTAIESVDAVKDKTHRQRTIEYVTGLLGADRHLDMLINLQLEEIKSIK